MKNFALALLLATGCGSAAPAPAASNTTPPPPPATPAFTPTAFGVQVSGAGRPVIFIPGLSSSGHTWDGTVAHLGGKVQAHVLTLAGFAGQPPIAGPFLQTVHDQIVEYIRANHLDHPVIVGHSLGGVMALWLGETVPDLGGVIDVDGLPFLGAVMDPSMTAEKAAADIKPMHDQMAALTPEQMAKQMHGFMASMVTRPEDLAKIEADSVKSDVATVANAFAELMGKDLRADLGKITAPTTIVAATVGGAPREMMDAAWHKQVDAIRGVNLVFVDNARHFVMLDQPAAFYAIVDKALH